MTNKIFVILFVFVGTFNSILAQSIDKQPRALFSIQRFYHPEEGAYIELYLSFDASSLMQVKIDDYYQSKMEVLYVIKKNDNIVKYDKFEVLGPKMAQADLYQDFLDVQTFKLQPDQYVVEVSLRDVNSSTSPIKVTQNLTVDFNEKKMAVSDVMFEKSIEETFAQGPLVKNGLKMIPWLVSVLPAFMDQVYVYAEVYNSDFELGLNGAYVEKHTLKNIDVDSIFPAYSSIKRVECKEVNVILKPLDLTTLPKGSYVYSIDLYNRDNELVASNGIQFYRESLVPELKKDFLVQGFADFATIINSETSRDSIVDFFRCIRPLGDYAHQNFIDKNWESTESEILKSYIISFWTSYKPESPTNEWLKYRALVNVVNKEFGNSIQKGYDTDRGMTYLQYGPPDQIVVRENEPSSYPYIIWQYYTHPKQSNAMYVFYDPSLTYRNYVLLHSNVRGEKTNTRWRLILQSRNNPNADIDQEEGVQHWGGRADDYFENPR